MSAALQRSTVSARRGALPRLCLGDLLGQLRSHLAGDITCRLIGTTYDGEDCCPRRACFIGADRAYGKPRRAPKAEIDESAWATLHPTVAHPFAPPSTGRIAVRVITTTRTKC